MAPPLKSYAELQRQFIDADLGRRETESRKAAQAAWHVTSGHFVIPPSLEKGVLARR
jgi:hypothetical protein